MLRDATLDLLKFVSLPDVASAVRNRIEAVMDRWQITARQNLPDADRLTREQLRDELPEVLSELANTLEADDGSSLADLEAFGEGHGRLRFHQSFNVNQLMIEFGLLRPIVLDEVVADLGRDLSPEESASINMGLDTAIRKSVTQFTRYQQEQLKVVTDAQSKYLSFLSHDIRGGLNGVLLTVEVLKRELGHEPRFCESLQDLDGMRRSILDTVGTMDRFLHAERFRQGKVTPNNRPVDLKFLLTDLCHQVRSQAKAKSLDLCVAVTSGLTAVTDKDLLSLIVQNLLANAIKYTQKGTVTVSAEGVDRIVRIRVIDTGVGIGPDTLETIFEPFTRGATHGQSGVGLGLSIARQAAAVIGGRLWAESIVGQGSRFCLDLP